MIVKSGAVSQGLAYVPLVWPIRFGLIGVKHSQQPQILLHQRLCAQPFNPPPQTARPSSSRQMLPPQPPTTSAALLSCRVTVSQHQDAAPCGHSVPPMACSNGCPSAGSQNDNRGQQETHTTATSLSGQIAMNSDRYHGSRDSSGQKIRRRRGRSPHRRGAKENALAVSSRLYVNSWVLFMR